jgi:hypothetical protein
VCDRGIVARTDKANEVKRAGGIGMLLLNVPTGATEIYTEILAVPHVHITAGSRDALRLSRKYGATQGATAELLPSRSNMNARAPQMLVVSSRGPGIVARGECGYLEQVCMMSGQKGTAMVAVSTDACPVVLRLTTSVHSVPQSWFMTQP